MKLFLVLKKIRVAISLFFFLAITFLFIDFGNSFSPATINGVLYFQFVPSIIKFLNLFSFAAAGFIFVLLLTFLFGRVYCSTFCPLGTLQDIVSFFSRKFRKKKLKTTNHFHQNKIFNVSLLKCLKKNILNMLLQQNLNHISDQ